MSAAKLFRSSSRAEDMLIPSALRALLLVALSFVLSGCASLENARDVVAAGMAEMVAPTPEIGPYDPEITNVPSLLPMSQAVVTPRLPQPQPQQPRTQSAVETAKATKAQTVTPPPPVYSTVPAAAPAHAPTLAPASSSQTVKGATRLMAANDPATLKVNARAAKTDVSPQLQPATTVVTADSGPGLVFKGPPRKFEPRHTARTAILVVFALCAIGGAVAAWTLLRRRAITIEATPSKEKPPEGLEFKEESSHPPDTVLEA